MRNLYTNEDEKPSPGNKVWTGGLCEAISQPLM
ncbi:hypothetical protein FOQG_08164 [Fusarium oxysporum f. sp. raphani 54005]|uniref:Uncharacterized protein n=8 Tax=Fusarium oxysporum TaxID=5507 RepID=W9I5R1_FUSOX|nr:hypothetical protein FOXG_18970 [Fusarium oxysporum f. sp. lycopersici 4287]EWY90218.1 hypothetical protein FOYG_07809 [Fusarium oxysporum NRRL 32931]EWZ36813.1 hypothetical protein FOZG_10762 [Fusarium oxysporum Fo47]EWZ90524.1 hypothetical protein FOWG_08145 [Fusarium oxysporum f. sp. lycopersici MN25]EXA44398.1 hypothetical protein FOVG_05847 [Fusarium oxysporum f. sp. pisi HDV247]EXK38852.1 hypothetical protein FOMG_06368 [Fusarium oxysporum f. sp. melonis 26406]EXK88897.1 hypothetical